MIAVTNNEGQLCNKLVLFANCLATGIEAKQRVVHFCGNQIRRAVELDTEEGKRHKFMCLPFDSVRQIGTAVFEASKFYGKKTGRENKPGVAKTIEESRAFMERQSDRLRNNRLFVVHDWYFRNPDALFRHKAVIQRYLRVKDSFCVRPLQILAAARQTHEIVVGVHLRRGDYKTYRGGKFYFDDEIYGRWMKDLSRDAPSSVCFLLCSNEPVDHSYFMGRGLNTICAPNHALEDLVALSLCDYVFGPPSTFSWWAAFTGNVPFFHVWGGHQEVSMRSFALPEPGSYP